MAQPHSLAARLLTWSLGDWERECASSFCLLRRFRSDTAEKVVEFMSGLEQPERQALARALVLRFHPEGATQLGELARPNEAALLREWDSRRRHFAKVDPISGGLPATKQGMRRIAESLRAHLAVLGLAENFGSQFTWRYVTPVNGWEVVTFVDLGGQFRRITYHHDIAVAGQLPERRFLSLFSWLGVSSQTEWLPTDPADGEAAGGAIAEAVTHFLRAARQAILPVAPRAG